MARVEVPVARARRQLRELLDRLAHGDTVEITRRGEPVAVLLSPTEHRRLTGQAGSLAAAASAFRDGIDAKDLLDDEALADLRERGPGRTVKR